MGRVGLYGRPRGLCSGGAVDGTRASTMPHERAAIKAPTQPYTAPAPTDGDGLFLRLMRTVTMLSQTILSTWIKWSRHQQKKLAQDAVGARRWGRVGWAFMVARVGG
jgi:hypothetical protein